MTTVCVKCDGKGFVPDYFGVDARPCPKCLGTGKQDDVATVKVEVYDSNGRIRPLEYEVGWNEDGSHVVDVVSVDQHLQLASATYQLEAEVERLTVENASLTALEAQWKELVHTSAEHSEKLIELNRDMRERNGELRKALAGLVTVTQPSIAFRERDTVEWVCLWCDSTAAPTPDKVGHEGECAWGNASQLLKDGD
jgi:hypothetical protein